MLLLQCPTLRTVVIPIGHAATHEYQATGQALYSSFFSYKNEELQIYIKIVKRKFVMILESVVYILSYLDHSERC